MENFFWRGVQTEGLGFYHPDNNNDDKTMVVDHQQCFVPYMKENLDLKPQSVFSAQSVLLLHKVI